ncbi:MAG: BatD family protein, partial [Ignavibacteriaceae bacterium]
MVIIKKIFAIIFFLPVFLFAQKFTASVNETTVADNERFQVSFIFSGKSINDLKNFKPPSFSNFLILSGPNQSTSIQIINGVQTASLTHLYILQPEKVGTYSIGKASIEQDGQTFETKLLKMQIVKGGAKPKQNITNKTISNEEIAKNLYIRAIIDKRKVYKGEQVTVVYKLYTRLTIASQMTINKLPQYQGFWTEELETASNITFNTEVVNGKQFRVGVLKKVALFPSQTGKLEVTPFELTVPVQIQRKRSRNIFDDFFGDPFG